MIDGCRVNGIGGSGRTLPRAFTEMLALPSGPERTTNCCTPSGRRPGSG
jgi:hypothetical protein